MKKTLLICFAALFLIATAKSQVTNEGYNYLLQFKQGGNIGFGLYGQTMNFYPVNDEDSTPTYTVPFATLCYNYTGAVGPEVTLTLFRTQTQGPYNATDLSIRGIFKNSPAPASLPCRYTTGTSGFLDDAIAFEKAHIIGDPRLIPKTSNNYNEFTRTVSNIGFIRLRDYWRYTNGVDFSAPLQFGTISGSATVRHINNNYSQPYNDPAYSLYGYPNTYSTAANSSFGTAPDVVYTFQLGALSAVTISTDNNATGFDTKIHLVRITGTTATSYVLLKTNDNVSESIKFSRLTDTLCAGTYGIIVEGATATDKGIFELTLQTQPFAATTGGTIDAGYTVPKPQEQFPLFINNVVSPAFFPARFSPIRSWEKSENSGSTWADAFNSIDSVGYILPPLNTTTQFRRVYNVCGTRFLSNDAIIKVVNPNGAISGKVKSISGAGVTGIEISVYKNGTGLPGSAAGFVYKDTTDNQGNYSVQRIYYGDPSENYSTEFIVKPFRANHVFDNDSLKVTLTNVIPQLSAVDFVDSTVYSLSGSVFQECNSCTSISGGTELQTCPLDSVRMSSNVAGVIPVLTGYDDVAQDYGRYALSVQNPGSYNVIPSYRNHLFLPPIRTVAVTGDVSAINFNDTSTRQITGRLTAGCGDYIGTAELEFTDILPDDAQGNPRVSCFRKRVTTAAGTGFYSIRLPARKYKVKVVGFNATADVFSSDLLDFFSVNVPADSLVRDITERDTTLNLVYQRPPVMLLEGLDNDCNRSPADSAFVVIPQGVTRSFLIKLYQGPAIKACPVTDTTLIINSNIQQEDNSEAITLRTQNGIDTVRLKGGTPNIVYPFYKTLNIQFNDIYGRNVQANRNVVVTGLKANIGSFATVSPEIPLMILHDPPGDNSSSFWETSKTNETAMRFYTAANANAGLWSEVKLGTSLITGLGVATETSVWGTIRGSIDVGTRKSTDEETIITTTTTRNFSTSDNSDITGAGGDVFIGAALNLKYAVTNEISFTPPCGLSRQEKLMIANDGFATEYIYSENHIRNTLLPILKTFRDNPGNTPAQTNNYANQINIWEQVLANNEANKRRAAFDKNISFDGSSGPITSTTTTSSTKNSTIEFTMELDAQLALELGFEAAGNGLSGGVNVGFKIETGNSRTNTTTAETTIGYTLDDDDDGDFFSVDIKKDPVYNTPVFELAAGTSSCPNEAGTQPRDEMQLTAPVPVVSGIAPDGEAEFILLLSNTSQSGEERTYDLSFVQSSNPNGAVVTIGGSPVVVPVSYTIGYLGQVQIVVKVRRGAANVFSYEGLQFKVTDNCGGDIEKTVLLSAFFTSTCSNIVLATPENNWVSSNYDNNIVPVLFNGYNIGNLTSVTLEYSKAGLSNWVEGFTRQAAQINNSSNGTLVNWNISGLSDGAYNLRLRLNCANGIVYSERVSGVIDRQAPVLLGRQQPTDDNYITGDVIGADFNENIDCSTLTNYNAELKRLDNGQVMDIRLGCYQNNIVIVPLTDITAFTGDSMQVTLRGIADVYGNIKPGNDVWKFIVGNSTPVNTSNTAKLVCADSSALENSGDSIICTFKLPVLVTHDTRINFTVSGNATWNTDYTIGYGQTPHQSDYFNGSQGSITIRQGTRSAVLKIKPIADTFYSPDKKIAVSLAEGGDYVLGDSSTITAVIVNDDTQDTYTFTGNGDFTQPSNWQNNNMPPYNIPLYDEIVIDPAGNGECVLTVPLKIRTGGRLIVRPGKKLRVDGNVRVVNY
jgi:hypothetical protein